MLMMIDLRSFEKAVNEGMHFMEQEAYILAKIHRIFKVKIVKFAHTFLFKKQYSRLHK